MRSGVAGSLRACASAIFGGEHYQAWDVLEHSVKTGETGFDHRFRMGVWEYFRKNPTSASRGRRKRRPYKRSATPLQSRA